MCVLYDQLITTNNGKNMFVSDAYELFHFLFFNWMVKECSQIVVSSYIYTLIKFLDGDLNTFTIIEQ